MLVFLFSLRNPGLPQSLLATLLAATLLAASPSKGPIYQGSEQQLRAEIPRVEQEVDVRIDGELDEEVWERAAVLTGFTQFDPAEGMPASERTETLVFYTPDALYLGIRAHSSNPAAIRATLADRDRILRDDHVQILLDTFDDQRRAYAFYVNPLGIQQDGIFSDGVGRRGADFSPDFVFESRGRVSENGYTVEIRIPLKSLKFPGSASQSWGINIIRHVAATGADEAWAPISRSNPSRLAQSGTLVGIHDLRPGRLVELNPTATGKMTGRREADGFRRGSFEPDFGGNLKVGVTSTFTLDATLNPDFSQIEADAGQITTNERFAIFFPEKRPFFLEGADIFQTPEPLVYTRSIADPIAGLKLTGKTGSVNLGYIGAVDESPLHGLLNPYAPGASRATFNILRAQRDIGENSSLGALATDREAGAEWNRVAGIDGRIRFRQLYTWQFQGAGSWTRAWVPDASGTDSVAVGDQRVPVTLRDRVGHLLQNSLDRTGRNWGFRLQAKDIPDAFRSESGFIRRTGITDLFAITRFTRYGAAGALLQSGNLYLSGNRIYARRDFWRGEAPIEGSASVRTSVNLRGNHQIEAAYANRFYTLDPDRYASYAFVDAAGDTRTGRDAVSPARELRGLQGFSLGARSSYFQTFSAGAQVGWEETPIFAEGTRGRQWSTEAEFGWRPTDALRADASLRHTRIVRAEDGSRYSVATLPRLELEYQLSRAIFLRAVGQYAVEEVDLLRAPGGFAYLRDGVPVRRRQGGFAAADDPQLNPLRFDLLFSYQPSPGTVAFLGYTREMNDAEAFRFSPLEPRADGLFLKLSYLFRS